MTFIRSAQAFRSSSWHDAFASAVGSLSRGRLLPVMRLRFSALTAAPASSSRRLSRGLALPSQDTGQWNCVASGIELRSLPLANVRHRFASRDVRAPSSCSQGRRESSPLASAARSCSAVGRKPRDSRLITFSYASERGQPKHGSFSVTGIRDVWPPHLAHHRIPRVVRSVWDGCAFSAALPSHGLLRSRPAPALVHASRRQCLHRHPPSSLRSIVCCPKLPLLGSRALALADFFFWREAAGQLWKHQAAAAARCCNTEE